MRKIHILAAALLSGSILTNAATAETVVTQRHFGPFTVQSQVVTPVDAEAGETEAGYNDLGGNGNIVRMMWTSSDGLVAFELQDNGEFLRSIYTAIGTEGGRCQSSGVFLAYSAPPATNSYWVNTTDDFRTVISSCDVVDPANINKIMNDRQRAADHYVAAMVAMREQTTAIFGGLWPRCLAYEGVQRANDPGDAPCIELYEGPTLLPPSESSE